MANWYDDLKNDNIPNTESGEQTYECLYQAIGKVSVEWERLEYALQLAFIFLLESSSMAGPNAYGVATSTSVRLEMLRGAAQGFALAKKIPEENLQRFLSALKTVSALAPVRNKVVHSVLAIRTASSLQVKLSGSQPALKAGEYYCLIAPFYGLKQRSETFQPKYRWDCFIIAKIHERISKLSNEVLESLKREFFPNAPGNYSELSSFVNMSSA